jgi:glycosyltransferase involved in cell wall biosynthesis
MKSRSFEESCRSDLNQPPAAAQDSPVLASVIVPAYNAGRFIGQTLDSVLAEADLLGGRKVEIIVVDDGSTDDTLARVRAYGNRVRCYTQPNSGGAAGPRNRAMSLARGEFLFFFDADDVMLPGKLQAALDVFAAEPSVGLVFTNFAMIDDAGDTIRSPFLAGYPTIVELERQPKPYHVLPGPFAHDRLIGENFIGTSGVAVRREVIQTVGEFDTDFYCGEDWDMWLRISTRYALAYVPRVLHGYRRHRGNITASDPVETIPSQIRVLSRYKESSPDPGYRTRLTQIIAGHEFSLAYAYYRNGRSGEAIASLSRAAVAVPRRKIYWAGLKALVGVRATTLVKRVFGFRRA